jgi:hypothetical protein
VTPIPTSITQLLHSLGPSSDGIGEVSFNDEDGSWAVTMDDRSEILVEWDDAPSRLLLSSLLGTAPVGREQTLYTAALRYNEQGIERGGVTVGLGGAGGEMMLMLPLSADAILVNELQNAVRRFNELTHDWTRYVAGDTDELPATLTVDEGGAPRLSTGAPEIADPPVPGARPFEH